MKKISILSVVALLFSISHLKAQVQKKDLLLGGTLSIGTNNYSGGNNTSNTNLNPRIGYAIGSNSTLSLRLGFGINTGKSPYGSNRYTNFSAGISWKRFFSIKEKFGWYTDVYGNASTGSSRQTSPSSVTSKITNIGFGAGLTPGIYYMELPRLIISTDFGGIGYSYTRNTETGSNAFRSSYINVNFLNYFSVGVDFILTKRKA